MADQSNKYYVSPKGNDDNPGLSEKTAWKTIEKVNQNQFQQGDAILFESGGIWNGNLRPLGSGKKGNPISISSYGEGSMPILNIGETAGAGITLVSQSWWEIRGIEITSGAPPQLEIKREGISIKAEEGGEVRGITIKDCNIHDIWGQVGGTASSRMIDIGHVDRKKLDAVNDILVEYNTIKRCDKVGIVVAGRNNIIVRHNYLENLGGDGIIVGGAFQGIIEYNIADQTCLRSGDPDLPGSGSDGWWPHTAAIWIIWCEKTVMQFNEVYNTGRQLRNGDGFAYDFDFECKNCILQYNYSENGHGLVLFMNRTYGNIARYNISHNDQTHLIQIHGNTEDGNLIHNNIFYVDHSTVDIDLHMGMEEMEDEVKAKLGATFKNNIFYATGQGRFRTVYSLGEAWDRKFLTEKLPPHLNGPIFLRNCYFGPWLNELPVDPEKLVADPMFISPGSGGMGLSSLKGFMLKAGSPCIDAGVLIEMDNNRDFFGNPVSDGIMNIGVHEKN